MDNFSQKHFLKSNNETNKQEQNIRSKSKKESLHIKTFKAKQ